MKQQYEPVESVLVPAPGCSPFPIDVLPAAVERFVKEASTAIGCDPAFVALPTLACLARAIGNTRSIRLKASWTELPIIWAAIIGKSGTHKSPALKISTAHLERKQAEAMEAYKQALVKHEEETAIYHRDYAAWKRSKTTEPPPWEPKQPTCRRYICGDITIEALADRLANQSDGVLIVRDELAGWLDGIAEYKGGKGSDTGHWLAAWNGAPMTVDRKSGGRPLIHVPRAAVSIVGGIQPGILRRAIKGEHMTDGMCARLLLAMPEVRPVKWSEAVVNPATEQAVSEIFEALLLLEPAADAEGQPTPFAIPLSPEAKRAWIDFFDRHRAEMADLDDDLAAAWSKLEAYAARFALIFQMCSWAAGEASGDQIDEASILAGINLADWFGGEAQRVYGVLVETDEESHLRQLAEWIAKRGGQCTVRELMHGPRKYRTDATETELLLNDLGHAGFGSWEHVPSGPKGGAPTRVFRLYGPEPEPEPH